MLRKPHKKPTSTPQPKSANECWRRMRRAAHTVPHNRMLRKSKPVGSKLNIRLKDLDAAVEHGTVYLYGQGAHNDAQRETGHV